VSQVSPGSDVPLPQRPRLASGTAHSSVPAEPDSPEKNANAPATVGAPPGTAANRRVASAVPSLSRSPGRRATRAAAKMPAGERRCDAPLLLAAEKPAESDLYDLLNALHVRTASIVGLSLGGRIAIDFALAHPDMVVALVPVATGVSGYEFSDDFMDRFSRVAAAASVQGPAQAAQLWLADPLFSVARNNPALHQKLLDIATANGNSWRTGPPADSRPPALDRLSQIHAPTLVIVGSADVPELQHLADTVAGGIPGARNPSPRQGSRSREPYPP
jgi:pimeloyl-ACP methyl ester carboxylesterase